VKGRDNNLINFPVIRNRAVVGIQNEYISELPSLRLHYRCQERWENGTIIVLFNL